MTTQQKKQSLFRWNAIIPFIIFALLTNIYFALFFDMHIKNAIEWVGYKALGSEVNIEDFTSSFIQGKVQINTIEITSSENPKYNTLEISDIHFNISWDALLRAKFVIEEIAVEGIQFMSERRHIGKVAPVPPSNPSEPSFTDQLQSKALGKLDAENSSNVLGDIAVFLKSGKSDEQMKNLESQLVSKKLLQQMNLKWAEKQKNWEDKLKTLPTSQELSILNEKFKKIKMKDFSSLDELNNSIKEADVVVKEISAKTTQLSEIKNQFDADIKDIDQDYKNVDLQTKKDIENLKAHFKIPKIDAASFAKSLFMSYLTPYTKKLDAYKFLAQKYLPPKYATKLNGKDSVPDSNNSIQPHVRSSGTTYEFPIKNGYPLFWIKNIAISSKSTQRADYGDFKGSIKNITSNQKQIGQPTTANLEGDFNKTNIRGIRLNSVFNDIMPESNIKFDFSIRSYPLKDITLLNSSSGSVSIQNTLASLATSGEITGLKKFDVSLNNNFNSVVFKTTSEDTTVQSVLDKTMNSISKFDLQATVKGEINDIGVEIRSSLGRELETAFQSLLQSKINEANEQLQRTVTAELDKIRSQVDKQVASIKLQTDGELKKTQAQIDEQKKQTEASVTQAKRDFEENIKKKLQKDGQKQLDELKKKFNL